MIGITWAANASLSSTTSTSSIVIPVRSRTFLIAPIGATPMYSGSLPQVAALTRRAFGVRPSSFAFVSDITSTAAAPSLSGHELPAVTPPSPNASGSSESFSSVEEARGPSSLATSLPSWSVTGHDLAVEEPVLLRLHGELLRALRVLVHVGAADLVLLRHVDRRQAHVDVGVRLAVLADQVRVAVVGAGGLGAPR